MQAWMHPSEKSLVTKYLSKEKVMLEWGSGGSTVEFSPEVKEYYSIEHNKEWFDKVNSVIELKQLNNVKYHHIAQSKVNTDGRQHEYGHFKEYLDIVDTFNTKFDIVLIDGRARRLCALKVIPHLKEDSIVIIHDWVLRDCYHCVTDYYDLIECIDENQTIGIFKLKKLPKGNSYTLQLGGWERVTENFFYKTSQIMEISIIQPSRNNLKYLKWSYESIRKNQGDHEVEICVADDASTDDTWEWCKGTMAVDPNFKAIRNDPENGRLGHTILYDRLINEVATKDIAMIYHADMYLCPNALDYIQKYIEPKKIVSLTRIEPPLHPSGPEKVVRDFGTEPEEFNEEGLLKFLYFESHSKSSGLYKEILKTTEGIFAPWAFYRKDFQEIGGHDPLYAPQSKEDSDIFNRFQLNGVKFVQTWGGFVYHMTCRGSRFNPTITQVGKESDEWLAQNQRSTRNFIRKWGHFVMHDKLMKPIIPPKYNIGLVLYNTTPEALHHLEPWFDKVWIDSPFLLGYVQNEQKNTTFNLAERVFAERDNYDTNIVVHLDAKNFNNEQYNYIQQLSQILAQHNQTGTFELGQMRIEVNSLEQYQDSLIFI